MGNYLSYTEMCEYVQSFRRETGLDRVCEHVCRYKCDFVKALDGSGPSKHDKRGYPHNIIEDLETCSPLKIIACGGRVDLIKKMVDMEYFYRMLFNQQFYSKLPECSQQEVKSMMVFTIDPFLEFTTELRALIRSTLDNINTEEVSGIIDNFLNFKDLSYSHFKIYSKDGKNLASVDVGPFLKKLLDRSTKREYLGCNSIDLPVDILKILRTNKSAEFYLKHINIPIEREELSGYDVILVDSTGGKQRIIDNYNSGVTKALLFTGILMDVFMLEGEVFYTRDDINYSIMIKDEFQSVSSQHSVVGVVPAMDSLIFDGDLNILPISRDSFVGLEKYGGIYAVLALKTEVNSAVGGRGYLVKSAI